MLSFNERDSQGTRTIFYSIVILSSAQRKLLSVVSANCRPDATADPGSHVLSSLARTSLTMKFPSAPTLPQTHQSGLWSRRCRQWQEQPSGL